MARTTAAQPQASDVSMDDCADNCEECHRVCLETLNYCLEQGGDHADPEHLKLLQDCADICRTSQDFIVRESEHHPAVCGACAEVCRACAESCEAFEDDEQMQKCAEACRRCAESCEAMAEMA